MTVTTALKHTNVAAHHDSNRTQTDTKIAAITANKMSAKYARNVMYCSQNMNGMPDG